MDGRAGISADATTTRPRPRARAARRWILAVSIGEAIGFAIAVGTAILTLVSGTEDPARFALIVGAGALEGTSLAIGQYAGMQANRPVAWRWIAATAAAAAFAWALGMLPGTLGLDLATPAMIATVAVGAALLLVSIPLAQALVLSRPHAMRWVPTNAGAWLVSILWTFAPSPFIDERSPIALVTALYVAAGVLMAVTFACLTTPVALRLFSPDASPAGPQGVAP